MKRILILSLILAGCASNGLLKKEQLPVYICHKQEPAWYTECRKHDVTINETEIYDYDAHNLSRGTIRFIPPCGELRKIDIETICTAPGSPTYVCKLEYPKWFEECALQKDDCKIDDKDMVTVCRPRGNK